MRSSCPYGRTQFKSLVCLSSSSCGGHREHIITVPTLWFTINSLLILWHQKVERNWLRIDGLTNSICKQPVLLACPVLLHLEVMRKKIHWQRVREILDPRISYIPDIGLSQFNLQYLPLLATKTRHRLNGMLWLGPAGEWTELPQTQEVGPIRALS